MPRARVSKCCDFSDSLKSVQIWSYGRRNLNEFMTLEYNTSYTQLRIVKYHTWAFWETWLFWCHQLPNKKFSKSFLAVICQFHISHQQKIELKVLNPKIKSQLKGLRNSNVKIIPNSNSVKKVIYMVMEKDKITISYAILGSPDQFCPTEGKMTFRHKWTLRVNVRGHAGLQWSNRQLVQDAKQAQYRPGMPTYLLSRRIGFLESHNYSHFYPPPSPLLLLYSIQFFLLNTIIWFDVTKTDFWFFV